jgi:uncharacterized membrane protein YfcA
MGAVALLIAATLAGATLQSAAGFGFALVLAPAAFAVLEPDEAVTVLLILGLELNLLVLFAERRRIEPLWGELRPLLLWALPGLVGGVVLLALLERPELQVAVGLLVIAAIALRMRGGVEASPTRPGGGMQAATGLATGALTTTTGTSGPPLVLWLERVGATPGQLRDTLAISFLVLDLLGIAALLAPGGAGFDLDASHIATLLAITLAGQLLGREIFARLPQEAFRRVAFALVLLTGLASITAGILS